MKIMKVKNQIIRHFLKVAPVMAMVFAISLTSCEKEYDAPALELKIGRAHV